MGENSWLDAIAEWRWIPSGFRSPWVLLLEAVPLLILFWIWNRRSRAVALPVDHVITGSGRVTRIGVGLAESLVPLVLALVVWICAGPLELGKPQTKRALTNILFCVDVSGSMSASFGEGTRYDASMKAIDQFLDYRKGDSFGLTFFGNNVLHWTPLTTEPSAIRCSIPFMNPNVVPAWFGGTEIGKALLECRKVLMEREIGDRMIILISDGSSSDLSGGNDVEVGNRLSDAGIVVFGVHIGEGDPPAEVSKIASLTDGEVFATADEQAMQIVFQRIDQMQKVEMEKVVAEQKDNFRPFAAVALLLAGLFVVTTFGLRYTPW